MFFYRLKFDNSSTNDAQDISNGNLENYREQILKKLNESDDPTHVKLVVSETFLN